MSCTSSTHPAVLLDLIFDRNEHQSSAGAMLLRNVAHRAGTACRLADHQRMAEMQPRAREHPARQFDRRQETAALRVSVFADPHGRHARQASATKAAADRPVRAAAQESRRARFALRPNRKTRHEPNGEAEASHQVCAIVPRMTCTDELLGGRCLIEDKIADG